MVNPSLTKIFRDLSEKKYLPFYLADGEEPYYIDQLTQYFEHRILSPAERDFNLIVLYGKDAGWADVVNACRRFPMFAERQVVILKDAAQMRSLNELTPYLEQPAPTTLLLIEHRFKKADGRSKLVKLAKEKGSYFTSDKLKEEQIPQWIQQYGKENHFKIAEREAQLLAGYLGNDLQKIVNEIEKVRINVPEESELTPALIQQYIGISREYNIFDFPTAFTTGSHDKLYRMLAYFTANPKAAPMPLIIGAFYAHFSTLYQFHGMAGRPEKEISNALKLYGDRLKTISAAAKRLSLRQTESCILILSEYSAKAVGIGSLSRDGALLKEMIGKLEYAANATPITA